MGEPLATNIDTIRDLVESAGATLITKEYVNNHSKIEFLCSNCGASVDSSLEREENFVVAYDLGDLVYVWEKDECNN